MIWMPPSLVCVNSNYIKYGVNSLRLGDLHLSFYVCYFKYYQTLHAFIYKKFHPYEKKMY